ncbi:EamA family transporter [Sulfoacidibacillus thermotolerans]|uniref:EamA domain-containing protein n=1 Tax=Sulfoacidibacillus thermotolerans TaxID=1765684 RepID=A0A2U3D6K3_SULT2|nr:EamA family transporter [Sulfoacidibacillus thermotolerans]PWI56902.1 hypothetical protein BM613_11300 [Sulfoacidibacillus thermotolerans]
MLLEPQKETIRLSARGRLYKFLVDAMLILIGVSWGYTFLITKYVIIVLPVFLFLGMRFLLAGMILGIPLWIKMRRLFTINDLKQGFFAGILLAFAYSLQTFGILHTNPGTAGMITELTTVLIPLLYFLLTRHPIG